MAIKPIFAWVDNASDQTRWLSLSRRGDGTCVMHLADVCLPGKLSRLTSASFPLDYLKSALAYGAFQVTLSNGYVLVRRVENRVFIEFKSFGDASSTKAVFLAEDFESRIGALEHAAITYPVLV